jgi:catechol 2,3-dioxygenase-like lactoylglutathione lyase family enzyme
VIGWRALGRGVFTWQRGEGLQMIQVKMVHHINVQITNRQRTRDWYEKVLGATFLDRGEALNERMLQLNVGNAEMHFSETDTPMIPKQPHFALEIANWDATLAHLDALGVEYSRTGQAFSRVGTGDSERWGKREDSSEHYTYIHDPDGNLIELVYHPLGLVDADGRSVAVPEASPGLRWRQLPEVEAELGKLAMT